MQKVPVSKQNVEHTTKFPLFASFSSFRKVSTVDGVATVALLIALRIETRASRPKKTKDRDI
jgi:hypothetical protein